MRNCWKVIYIMGSSDMDKTGKEKEKEPRTPPTASTQVYLRVF